MSLWVISRHLQCKMACPLYPRKRTYQWDTRGKKPNDPAERFSVPLFCNVLIRLRWRSPLGTAKTYFEFPSFLARIVKPGLQCRFWG